LQKPTKRKEDCCTIAGWGKTASDEKQLNEFIEKEKEYTVLYDNKTPLFPKVPRMTWMKNYHFIFIVF
jgi:hypothetical protein